MCKYDCKTVGFSPKSVKKSRVLRARSARASHAHRARSLFSASFQAYLFDCSRVLEYAKIRTVLQSMYKYIFVNVFCVESYVRLKSFKVWKSSMTLPRTESRRNVLNGRFRFSRWAFFPLLRTRSDSPASEHAKYARKHNKLHQQKWSWWQRYIFFRFQPDE